MSKTLAIVGSQWGDEGKGKITDYFSGKADMVVRWAGGNNAGHTIKIKDKKYHLSLIPSGIFNSDCKAVIATGCVVDLEFLVKEINYLKKEGISLNNLLISNRCHIVLPYHIKLDHEQEKWRGKNSISTTKKGIGPCYEDKFKRSGILISDLFDKETFKNKLENNLKFKNELFTKIYKTEPINIDDVFSKQLKYFDEIKHFIKDTSIIVNEAIDNNKKVLFEGAQGVMLDINFGTYPFVTSSNPSATSIPINVGIGNNKLNRVLGVSKAYNTRVGNGAFPSEIKSELAVEIRELAGEYGVVTKRPRRIGWLDTMVLKHSSMVSGYNNIVITLLDILSILDEIKICVQYKIEGKIINYMPATIEEYNKCEPVFITLPGWKEDITNIKDYDSLPINAKKYLSKIEDITNLKIVAFSVGPKRSQTVVVDKTIF